MSLDEIDEKQLTRYLTNVWVEVLKHDAFGIDSDLYEVGAHSMAVIQTLDSIIQEFNVTNLEMEAFFNNVTIAKWVQLLVEHAHALNREIH